MSKNGIDEGLASDGQSASLGQRPTPRVTRIACLNSRNDRVSGDHVLQSRSRLRVTPRWYFRCRVTASLDEERREALRRTLNLPGDPAGLDKANAHRLYVELAGRMRHCWKASALWNRR